MPRGRPKKKTEVTEEGVEDTKEKTSSSAKVHDFGVELPALVEVPTCELDKVEGYEHQLKGRFWRGGQEIVCVRLISKHM